MLLIALAVSGIGATVVNGTIIPLAESAKDHAMAPEVSGVITIEDGEAFEITRQLAIEEGIFVGMSSGAAVAGALHVAEKMNSGTIVVILPDRGDRYLSTTLFRSICAKCPP